MSQKQKGDLLEDIVASLHKHQGAIVRKNVFLKPVTGKGRKREFDIILEQEIAGYKVKIPIECKNQPKKKIDAPKIDAFVGKLNSVGLPTQNAVYVTSGDYTKGAIERAKQANIKTLTLTGLNEDGLSSLYFKILNRFRFKVCEIGQLFFYSKENPKFDLMKSPVLYDSNHKTIGHFFDVIWNTWLHNNQSMQIGSYEIDIAENFGFMATDPKGNFVKVSRLHFVLNIKWLVVLENSSASLLQLQDENGDSTKGQISFKKFRNLSGQPIYSIHNEEELEFFSSSLNEPKLTVDIQVNRIKLGSMYWPPSLKYVEKSKKSTGQGIVHESKNIIESDLDEFEPTWQKLFNQTVGKNQAQFIFEGLK